MLPMEPDTPEVWLPWLAESDPEARDLGASRFCVDFPDGPAFGVLPMILVALDIEPEAFVRSTLVAAVRKLDPQCEYSAAALRSRLADLDPDVRRQSVELLGRLRPTPLDLLSDLKALWQNDPDELVQMAAAVVLSREEPDSNMGNDLGRILSEGHDFYSRVMAACCFKNLGDFALPYRDVLRSALSDSDELVRQVAAEVLARWNHAELGVPPDCGGIT